MTAGVVCLSGLRRLLIGVCLIMAMPSGADARQVQPREPAQPRPSYDLTSPGDHPASDPLALPVNLSVQNVPLTRALELLVSGGAPLVYSVRLVEGVGPVSCACEGFSLGQALNLLLARTSLTYRATPAGEVVLLAREVEQPTGFVLLHGSVMTPTLEPVRGALLAIPELSLVTVSDELGRYRLRVPSGQDLDRHLLQVSSIGYRSRSIPLVAGRESSVRRDITLVEEAVQLDEVIVAGTAGRQERRAQAALVASVDAERIVQLAPVSTASHMLQARVPGVNVTSGSGSVGASQRIRIRGISSLILSSSPLVFVDGVAVASHRAQVFNVGSQSVSRLDDLRPDEIESIEIVKGPAAATLYGADGSAGVISIRTKQGGLWGGFTHTSTLEVGASEPAFHAPYNWAECTQGLILANVTACHGQPVGALISDHPLDRYRVFRTGASRSLAHSVRGGGDNFAAYLSVGADRENGTVESNTFARTSLRGSFGFYPSDRLEILAGFGLSRAETRLPYSDNLGYGLISAAVVGSPLTVGTPADGWFAGAGLGRAEGRLALENWDDTYRIQPRLELTWSPATLTHRMIIGGDMTRTQAWAFTPRNDHNWYQSTEENTGIIRHGRLADDRLTLDYLGNYSHHLSPDYRADLSWGSQMLMSQRDFVSATGVGLVSNALRTVSSAREQTGTQSRSEGRSLGFLGQLQLGARDRLFAQVAGRVDRSASFGAEARYFYSPRIGLSYVISEEPFWRPALSFAPTLRLRAALGTSGRSPRDGSRATYALVPYLVLHTDSIAIGIRPSQAGNPQLRPERTTELEVGLDAALLNDRVSLEVTYFDKATADALLYRSIAPSAGSGSELVNIAQLSNRGVELTARARLVARPEGGWETALMVGTLRNRVVSLGNVQEFGTVNRTRVGAPAGAIHTRVVEAVDLERGVAIVSDAPKMMGNVLPGLEVGVGNTVYLGRALTLYLQVDHRGDFVRYNHTDEYRDRWANNSERWVRRNELPADERLRRFGPYVNSAGTEVGSALVLEPYVEDASFTRLREASLTYRIPAGPMQRIIRTSDASITFAGRNLLTWSGYSGLDPETLHTDTSELFTIPVERRWSVRLNLRH